MQKPATNESRTHPMSLRYVSCHLCLGLPSCFTFPTDILNELLIQADTDCIIFLTPVRATWPSHLMRLFYLHSNRTTVILTKSNTKGDGRSPCPEFCTRDSVADSSSKKLVVALNSTPTLPYEFRAYWFSWK